ncbi:type I methionyl aminopeptidase [Crossiella sp. CA-258035]|uniref:type I methionyl aminopeptidase n=1 Tax=Crossiella sp. CA-258035 TaxID=2981138 RepID=UPI0024BD39A6|nr:type I methionyl aminopeptidase [Crossiella sp. CA-258035]WHT17793.1 type I methionyl aminopeptidase [Crossiella sp. CA-258035]
MVIRKTDAEIDQMAKAGAILAEVHEELRAALRPGRTTADLDRVAAEAIERRGGKPGFFGYNGYPAVINASLGEQIVHGIPSRQTRLREGDILSLDCGVLWNGFHSDAACTWIVGEEEAAPEHLRALVADTYRALWAGIGATRVGNRIGDISAAIGAVGAAGGYGVVSDHNGHAIGGHGIGRSLHEDPFVPGRGRPGRGLRLKPGLVLAIEPMFTTGHPGFRTLGDEWTVVTVDGSTAAHWEHTVAVTESGPRVLTARPEEVAMARIADLG